MGDVLPWQGCYSRGGSLSEPDWGFYLTDSGDVSGLSQLGLRAEIEAPSLHPPSASSDKFARMIALCTASLLGHLHQFTEMSKALEKKDAIIGKRDQRISRLEEDLAHATEGKRKSDEELQVSQLENDRLRGQAHDLEACGYDRF